MLTHTNNLGATSFEVNVNNFFKLTWDSTWKYGTGNNLTVTALKNCHIVGHFDNATTQYSVDNNYNIGQSFGYVGTFSGALGTAFFNSAEIVAY